MQSKTVQASTPDALKLEVDLIIAADTPTFMQVTALANKSFYLIIWIP